MFIYLWSNPYIIFDLSWITLNIILLNDFIGLETLRESFFNLCVFTKNFRPNNKKSDSNISCIDLMDISCFRLNLLSMIIINQRPIQIYLKSSETQKSENVDILLDPFRSWVWEWIRRIFFDLRTIVWWRPRSWTWSTILGHLH